ncbi:MAG TPA: ABC transporter permease [Burkholderiales bacterium]|nr:ABC transporter permease [Burkholderiales bacterium]
MLSLPVVAEQLANAIQLGAMLFLAAAGLTLVFGIMNFINLAHGSLYMLGAFIGASVLALTQSFAAAIAAALAGAAAVGLALEWSVLRRLYERDHNAQVLGTFGLILFFNEAVRMIWGNAPLFLGIPNGLEGTLAILPGVPYSAYRLAITLIGLAVAGAMALLITRTRVGALIRAGASNREILQAMGIDVRRLFAFVFALGGALAGLAGALTGPIQSVQVGMGEPVLILAFVVIVIGGIGSVRGAFVGSMLVGLVDTLGRALLPKALGYTVGPALASMAIFVLMSVMLYFRPTGLFPVASSQVSHPIPAPRPISRTLTIIAIAVVIAAALLPLSGETFYTRVLTRALAMGLAAIGLDLVFGYGGMISFGHAAFLGVGAYAVGILASYGIAEGLLALPVAVACAALAGLIIGALSIRTSGVFFIMITLAFAQMLYYVAIGLEAFGGDNGMPLKLPTTIGGTLDLSKPQLLYWVALACVLATLYLGGKVVRSEFGLALRAIRDNEQRMQTLGYATYRYKVVAYTVSGGICGLAGALLANVDSYVGPSMFHWFTSGLLMVMVILGGQGTLIGPLLGALVYVVLEEALSQLTEHWMVIFGPLLIVIVLLRNRG